MAVTKSYTVTNAAGFSADIELRIINNNPYIETSNVPDGYSLWVKKDATGDTLYRGSNDQDGVNICTVDLSNASTIEAKLSAIKGKIFFAKGLAADFDDSLTVKAADGSNLTVLKGNIVQFSA